MSSGTPQYYRSAPGSQASSVTAMDNSARARGGSIASSPANLGVDTGSGDATGRGSILTSLGPSNLKIVSLEEEYQRSIRKECDAKHPSFVRAGDLVTSDPGAWFGEILPQVSGLTFIVESTVALQYFKTMLSAEEELPQLWRAITKLSLPGFHWFSGIGYNRQDNPYVTAITALPFVNELTLRFHTAGLTTSRYGERERIAIEENDLERSKELKVLRQSDITKRYGLQALFKCERLEVLHLECIDSDMVAFHCKSANPVAAFRDLRHYFVEGFKEDCNRTVMVDLKVFDVAGRDQTHSNLV